MSFLCFLGVVRCFHRPWHRPYPDQPFDHDDGVDNCQVEFNTMVRKRGQFVGGVPTFAMASFRKDKDHFLLQVCAIPALVTQCARSRSNNNGSGSSMF